EDRLRLTDARGDRAEHALRVLRLGLQVLTDEDVVTTPLVIGGVRSARPHVVASEVNKAGDSEANRLPPTVLGDPFVVGVERETQAPIIVPALGLPGRSDRPRIRESEPFAYVRATPCGLRSSLERLEQEESARVRRRVT